MKTFLKFVVVFWMCFQSATFGAERVKVLVLVTNLPVQGNTFVLNGNTRTWTTNTPNASQIQIGSSISISGTNFYEDIIAAPFTIQMNTTQTNGGALFTAAPGVALTASKVGSWGVISTVTNTTISAQDVSLPFTSWYLGPTNLANQLISGLNTYASTSFQESLLPGGQTSTTNAIGDAHIQTAMTNRVLYLSVKSISPLSALSINNASALTNANATSVFGSGTIPNGYLSGTVSLLGQTINLTTESDLNAGSLTNGNATTFFVTGTLPDARLSGNVSLLGQSIALGSETDLNASSLTNGNATTFFASGTLPDARLSGSVSLLGQVIALGTESDLNASSLTNGNATTFFATGTLPDARLSGSVSLLGQLIQLGTESDLNGSSITNLNATQLTSGTIPTARYGSEVVQTSRSITAGLGLTGGGDLSSNRSFAIDPSIVVTNGSSPTFLTATIQSLLTVNTNIVIGFGGMLGIGTNNPIAPLHVSVTNIATATPIDLMDVYGNNNPSFYVARRAMGTREAPTAVQTDTSLNSFNGRGYGATAFSSGRAILTLRSSEPWSDSAQGAKMSFFVTSNGTSTISEQMTLQHNGNLGIGTTNATERLTVTGNESISGTFNGMTPANIVTNLVGVGITISGNNTHTLTLTAAAGMQTNQTVFYTSGGTNITQAPIIIGGFTNSIPRGHAGLVVTQRPGIGANAGGISIDNQGIAASTAYLVMGNYQNGTKFMYMYYDNDLDRFTFENDTAQNVFFTGNSRGFTFQPTGGSTMLLTDTTGNTLGLNSSSLEVHNGTTQTYPNGENHNAGVQWFPASVTGNSTNGSSTNVFTGAGGIITTNVYCYNLFTTNTANGTFSIDAGTNAIVISTTDKIYLRGAQLFRTNTLAGTPVLNVWNTNDNNRLKIIAPFRLTGTLTDANAVKCFWQLPGVTQYVGTVSGVSGLANISTNTMWPEIPPNALYSFSNIGVGTPSIVLPDYVEINN